MGCLPKPVWAIYTKIFFDIVGGTSLLLHGLYLLFNSIMLVKIFAALYVPFSIILIILGAMLWKGLQTDNDTYIFVYLVVKVAFMTYVTLASIIFATILDEDVFYIFMKLVILLILWCIYYGVYVYYKELVNATTSVVPGNIIVTYDNIKTQESKMEEAAV